MQIMINIILMRHWEADGNVRKILMWCKEGSFLTNVWEQQVEVTGKYLGNNEHIDYIFASPVYRAKQTANIINKYIGKKIEYFEELREIDWGRC